MPAESGASRPWNSSLFCVGSPPGFAVFYSSKLIQGSIILGFLLGSSPRQGHLRPSQNFSSCSGTSCRGSSGAVAFRSSGFS